jgi:phosphotransferase system  glucose/maltose/N-acetylglucosamine-specific IIC component
MDFSKFKTSDWLMIGGGVLTLIGGLFLDWIKVESFSSFSGGDAFDFTLTGALPWLLIIASTVITVLLVLEKLDPQSAAVAWGCSSLSSLG